MTPEERQLRGNEARYILENEVFKDAFEMVEASIINQMREVKSRDTEMHSELIRRLQTMKAIQRALVQTMETGKLAERELQHKSPLLRAVGNLVR